MGISLLSSFTFPCSYIHSYFKGSSNNHFAFLHFFSLGMILITVSCTMLWNSVHSSSGILSDLIPLIYFSLPVYNCKWFDLGLLEWLNGFPTDFNLSLDLIIRSSWSEAQSAPGLVFCWVYSVSPCLAAKNTINLILVLTIWWCPCVESSLMLLEEGVYHDPCVLLAELY